VDYIQWTGSAPPAPSAPASALAEALDSDLSFSTYSENPWFAGGMGGEYPDYYYEADSARAYDLDDSEQAWMETIVEVDGQETVSFYSEGLVRTEW